jgi:DNA-binding protein H-NS
MELLAAKAELDGRIEQMRKDEVARVIGDIKRQMIEYSISLSDLEEEKRSRRNSSWPHLPRYRDPVSGAIWSGRGRPPGWFRKDEKDRYLIR